MNSGKTNNHDRSTTTTAINEKYTHIKHGTHEVQNHPVGGWEL